MSQSDLRSPPDKMTPSFSLVGKVAMVTGGASGIGRATAMRLATAGARVAILDIDRERGEAVAAEIRQAGGQALFCRCDVTSGADCQAATAAVQAAYGRIDILFNNAGMVRRKDVVELEEAEWDQVLAINLKSVYLLSRYVIPVMAAGGGGSIINTGSGWGLMGGPKAAAYCAAKGGVVNLTRAMAIDHGRQGIRVNCVCPGDTDTPLLRDEARQLGVEEGAFLAASAQRPLARLGTPLDVAHAVLYLASDMSSWVTGAVLAVDGGGTAGH